MGTEFSRRVSAWISVSGSVSVSDPRRVARYSRRLLNVENCGERTEEREGRTDRCRGGAGSPSVGRSRLQLRFVLRGIKSMGTACSRPSPAEREGGREGGSRERERTHLVVQLSETLHRFREI